MAKQIPTCEEIIKAWKKADAKSDKPLGAKDIAVAMGISPYWIWKRFAACGVYTRVDAKYCLEGWFGR